MGGGDVESQVGGTQESGESLWFGGGDVESLVGGTQKLCESSWFGGGLDGVDQGSPRVVEGV